MKADFQELDTADMYESEDFEEAKNDFNSFVKDIYESDKDEIEDFIEALEDSVNVHATGRFTLILDSSKIRGIQIHRLKRITNFEIYGIHVFSDDIRLRIQYKG